MRVDLFGENFVILMCVGKLGSDMIFLLVWFLNIWMCLLVWYVKSDLLGLNIVCF